MPMAIPPMVDNSRPIILASGSTARRAMLEQAGVAFTIEPAEIDEAAVRNMLLQNDPAAQPATIAQALAQTKAETVSRRIGGALVIGSDQILNLESLIMTKPNDLDAVRATLQQLRGQTHQLHSAVSIAIDGVMVWSTVDTASLTMRRFSTEFLDRYLELEGESLLAAVGAFKLEGRGLQLFQKIEGDYFTILGMPLLPLLAELRLRGAIET